MTRPAAERETLLGALLPTTALLLATPQAFASLPTSISVELLAPRTITVSAAGLDHQASSTATLAAGLEDRGFKVLDRPATGSPPTSLQSLKTKPELTNRVPAIGRSPSSPRRRGLAWRSRPRDSRPG